MEQQEHLLHAGRHTKYYVGSANANEETKVNYAAILKAASY